MKRLLAILFSLLMVVSTISTAAFASDKYDLSNFGWRYVDSKGRGSLVFQKTPRGKSMKGHKFYTGDQIYVNLNYREDGYGIAYENGEYGYVDASYINWGDSKSSGSSTSSSKSSSGMSSSEKDLSNFEYRRVASNGRGSLVFQKSPRGKSMKGHKFYDGDWIYVNVNYRKDGYSIAYENGEYGYVDASYIDWGSSKGGSSTPGFPSTSPNSDGEVALTGNVNIRSGPGLDYSIIGEGTKGRSLSYAGETRYDDRGVAWYSVYYNGRQGWVSSKFSFIRGTSSGKPISGTSTPKGNAIEISGYYGQSISAVASALGGGFTVTPEDGEDDICVTYERNGLWLVGGNQYRVNAIHIEKGSQYSLLGITIGMSEIDAKNILMKYPYSGRNDYSEYIIEETEAYFEIEYSNGRVVKISYGIWS